MSSHVDERYERDPQFRALVNTVYNLLMAYEFTPTETREACMMAQVKFEMTKGPRPVAFSKDLLAQIGAIEKCVPDWEKFK